MFKWLKKWWSFDAATYRAPDGIPSPDESRKLVLYKSATCAWCHRVMHVLRSIEVDVEIRDIHGSPENRQLLWDSSQRTQVPCLFIDNVPFFESADISKWLRAHAVRGPANRATRSA